ncbi:hypothetical protein RBB84_02250 [Rhodococcus sp. D-6]|nr:MULTISPECIES: hypothetical protein [Rhodococcus]MCT7291757.1 hypothetical protein [Rhodococcus sp. PAE-6]
MAHDEQPMVWVGDVCTIYVGQSAHVADDLVADDVGANAPLLPPHPAMYRVVVVAAIDDPEPAVTIDEQERVWVATKKDVLLLDPAGTLVELDIAARLRTE